MSPRVQSSVSVAACLLLIVLCSHPSTGAILLGTAERNPEHPNSCWLKDLNKAIPVGGSLISENKCEQYFCEADTDNDTQLLLTTHQCGSIAPPPGCVNKRDLSKPYPGCCGGEFVCN